MYQCYNIILVFGINSDWAKKTKVFLSLERLKPGETHMNMTQLEYFLAICKYNNISKAATQLFISQPALSQQLIRLEKELGAALFIRRENSLMLTEIGEGFQESAKRILFEYNNSKSMIDDIRRYRDPADQVGHLSVAVKKQNHLLFWLIFFLYLKHSSHASESDETGSKSSAVGTAHCGVPQFRCSSKRNGAGSKESVIPPTGNRGCLNH